MPDIYVSIELHNECYISYKKSQLDDIHLELAAILDLYVMWFKRIQWHQNYVLTVISRSFNQSANTYDIRHDIMKQNTTPELWNISISISQSSLEFHGILQSEWRFHGISNGTRCWHQISLSSTEPFYTVESSLSTLPTETNCIQIVNYTMYFCWENKTLELEVPHPIFSRDMVVYPTIVRVAMSTILRYCFVFPFTNCTSTFCISSNECQH